MESECFPHGSMIASMGPGSKMKKVMLNMTAVVGMSMSMTGLLDGRLPMVSEIRANHHELECW